MCPILCFIFVLAFVQVSHNDKITKELDQLFSESKNENDQKQLHTSIIGPANFIKYWPTDEIIDYLGQLSGLSFCPKGFIYILQRADREMTERSFDEDNHYTLVEEGPIKDKTILVMNKKITDPYIVKGFGDNLFYLPHGIFVDEQYIWTTDVALHQVFRFPRDSKFPDLILGERFVPGNDNIHFCKPTHAVTAKDGSLFVADGYCNSRIVKFDKTGKYIMQFGHQKGFGQLSLPHHLAIIESKDLICAADRENNRIQCYGAGLKNENSTGKIFKIISDFRFGPVYAIAFNKKNNILYIVSGIIKDNKRSRVFLYNWNKETITGTIDFPGPNGFGLAHTISVSPGQNFLGIGSLTKECPADMEICLDLVEDDESYISRNIWLYGV